MSLFGTRVLIKLFLNFAYLKVLRRVLKRQRTANVAASLSHTEELDTTPVPQLIITDCGVHWTLLTLENGEIAVSVFGNALYILFKVNFFFFF